MDSNQEEGTAASPPAKNAQFWIENEGLLRDEGAIFGLSGLEDGLEHKLNTIRTYFGERIAAIQRKNQRFDREIDAIEQRRQEQKERLGELHVELENPPIPELEGGEKVSRHVLLRYAFGFLLAVGVCGFNFYLVFDILTPYFERPLLVTLGVFLAGLFVLFQPTSLFFTPADGHGNEKIESWKSHLIEFGMPVTASIFVVGWGFQELGAVRSVAVFVFLFMVFLLSGKLVLSVLPGLAHLARVLVRDFRVWLHRWRTRRKISTIRDDILPALADEEEDVERRRDELTDVSEVESQRESKIELFSSEYALARKAVQTGLIRSEDAEQILSNADVDETVVQ